MSELKPMFYNVSDFCKVAGISRSFFYKLQHEGKAPPVAKMGARNLIAMSDVTEWQKAAKEPQAA
jgi:predicted DNA-binding transcriptional regulator AlpA